MALHHDLETVTLVVYMNDRFEGCGTHFPKWNYVVSGRRPGEAILSFAKTVSDSLGERPCDSDRSKSTGRR